MLVSRLKSEEGRAVVYYEIANPHVLKTFDLLREILFEQIRQDAALIQGA
jgi:hypothetical protein